MVALGVWVQTPKHREGETMTRKLSKDELQAMRPCDLHNRLALFGSNKSLTVRQALNRGATVSDLLWVAGQMGLRTEVVKFARLCADHVAHIKNARVAYAAAAYADAAADAADAAADAAAAAAADAADAADADAAYAYAWTQAREKEREWQRKQFIRIFA